MWNEYCMGNETCLGYHLGNGTLPDIIWMMTFGVEVTLVMESCLDFTRVMKPSLDMTWILEPGLDITGLMEPGMD